MQNCYYKSSSNEKEQIREHLVAYGCGQYLLPRDIIMHSHTKITKSPPALAHCQDIALHKCVLYSVLCVVLAVLLA